MTPYSSLRVHPGTGGNGSGSVTSTSIVGFTVTYTGKSAHAGVSYFPWITIPELIRHLHFHRALRKQQSTLWTRQLRHMSTFQSCDNRFPGIAEYMVSLPVLRSGRRTVRLCPSTRKDWSLKSSVEYLVIPGEAKLQYGIRAPSAKKVMDLVPRVLNCFKAGALSTGCEVDIAVSHVYLDLQPCTKLEEYYREHCQSRWGSEGYVASGRSSISASTDFVSLPSKRPTSNIA